MLNLPCFLIIEFPLLGKLDSKNPKNKYGRFSYKFTYPKDLFVYCGICTDEPHEYSLVAEVIHQGDFDKKGLNAHVVAHVQNFVDKKWMFINNEAETESNGQPLLGKNLHTVPFGPTYENEEMNKRAVSYAIYIDNNRTSKFPRQ